MFTKQNTKQNEAAKKIEFEEEKNNRHIRRYKRSLVERPAVQVVLEDKRVNGDVDQCIKIVWSSREWEGDRIGCVIFSTTSALELVIALKEMLKIAKDNLEDQAV